MVLSLPREVVVKVQTTEHNNNDGHTRTVRGPSAHEDMGGRECPTKDGWIPLVLKNNHDDPTKKLANYF